MPQPGLRWRFITINTKNAWHHGAPRGFRSRHHRIQSSGDYRKPPPKGEHEGLYRYRIERAGKKVTLPAPVRPRIAAALADHLSNYRLKAIIGHAKRHASREVRDALPGAIWSAGCDYEPVDDIDHFNACEEYALIKQGTGTWTWWHADGGM